ncbi:hypothetical protein OAK75_05395 [Bacteriovoracales bacterium]|nr:hypothetical protein [Bacteriovoracales bacterium]
MNIIKLIKLFILFTPIFLSVGFSSETDQLFALNKYIEDSTGPINEIINQNLVRAVEKANRKNYSCYKLTKNFAKEVGSGKKSLRDMPIRKNNSIDQIPRQSSNRELFYEDSIYYGLKRWDIGIGDNRFLSPTLEVNGVRLGADKISHITFIGLNYYKTFSFFLRRYKKKFSKDKALRKALEKAINFGVFQESTITGKSRFVSGLFSFADMEANYQGLRLFHNICGSENPYVNNINGQWYLQKKVDITPYITPELDETYYPNYFRESFWKKVKTNMLNYCNESSFKALAARKRYYSTFKKKSFSYYFLKEKIRKGKLKDPSRFTLENVCSRI